MEKRWRRVGWVYLGWLLVAGAVVVGAVHRYGLDAAQAALMSALALAVPPLYLGWKAFSADRRDAAAGPPDLAAVADDLAVAVRTQWQKELDHRQVVDPYPLPVSWRPAAIDLVEAWEGLLTTARSRPGHDSANETSWAARPTDLAASGLRLAAVLGMVPTRRLLVLGEPGSGKTTLLVNLVLDLLDPARRTPGDPVPVLLPLASWDPAVDTLDQWVIAQLLIGHLGLAGFRFGMTSRGSVADATLARMLWDHGLILPILDGLDELPEQARALALDRINTTTVPAPGLVLTSRTTDYRTAIRPASGLPVRLRSAAGITLEPLGPAAVDTYLRRAADPLPTRWAPVLAELGQPTPVGEAFTNPLVISLARTIYNPRPGEAVAVLPEPGELCDHTRFPTSPAILERLCDGYLPAAYRPHPDPARRCRWTSDQAERWLIFLAHHLTTRTTTTFAWWELSTVFRWWEIGIMFGVVVGVLNAVVGAVVNAVEVGGGMGLVVGVLGVVVGGVVLGAVGGIVGGFAFRFLMEPSRTASAGLRFNLRTARFGVVVGTVFGVVAGTAFGSWAGTTFGLWAGIAIGIAAGAAAALEGVPIDVKATATPDSTKRQDRAAFLTVGAIGGVFFGLALGVSGVALAGASAVGGSVAAAVGGVAFGFGVGLSRARWGQFTVARVWLAVRRTLPWPLMEFLRDAHIARGVLRQVGPFYQFRHLELQRRLASRWHS